MEIRAYRSEDWAAVCAIYDLAKPEELRGVVPPSMIQPLDADAKMKSLFRDSRIVVAEHDGDIAGFAGNRDTFITWLFVHPNSRRKGVASALVHHLLSEAQGPVTLNVVRSNIDALAFYHGIGFAVELEYPGNFQGNPCQVVKLRHETAA